LVSRADADFQISDRQSVEKNTYNVDSIWPRPDGSMQGLGAHHRC
jgi:hypothetical protein